VKRVNLCPKLVENAFSDALLLSSFQKIAADAAFKNRASRGFFLSLSSKVLIDSQILARKPDTDLETCLHPDIQVQHPYPSLAIFAVCTCCLECFGLYVRGLGLCLFSGLVYDLLLRRLNESALPEGLPKSKCKVALLGGHQPGGALPTLVGGHPCNGRYVPW